ncbi:Gfo/Idh/MocA family protein [Phytoactinopolyspora halotolerans]|uniref:Gfo/Idh/MocA family oxidoreductase n=1 Tax=Phytoactinopolyspora halotolerans TaxID=1981512 RepID=A0A6L9SDR7_9ACTN|nr:Gfo/Idh/MocA family oxidoreductase [Phytoactinopolyspora halotolerans]NEE03237.1 Gfo/Idh/MocA family oxidoreductase [Phytoactinopolyspora halotolerans]
MNRVAGVLNVALVGCGHISGQYLASMERLTNVRLVSVSDVNDAAAQRVAGEQGVPVRSWTHVLKDDDVDVVLNLTPPQEHARLTVEALEAGKHVYLEKPFAVSLAEADEMLEAAERTGRRIGSAPDTVLGTGIQTARWMIDQGKIGQPVAATAFMMSPGHEGWHPNPGFYYLNGGGPLLDMGVYYLTALVTMLGPITQVMGMGSRARMQRVVPDGAPRAGETLPVEVDTHITANLRHASGALSTLIVSFDTVASRLPKIEVYGTEASMSVPDPNRFSGVVSVARRDDSEFVHVGEKAGYLDAGRGFGLSDLARAILDGTGHRQSAALGYHVNEVMIRVLESADHRRAVHVQSTCERPVAVPLSETVVA